MRNEARKVSEFTIGEVVLAEGSRVEWDSIAGIGIPGAGTVTGIQLDSLGSDSLGIVVIYVDPNEGLRAMAAELLALRKRDEVLDAAAGRTPFTSGRARKTGLDGGGGFLLMTGDAIEWGIRSGTMRVLPERRAPETWAAALEEERRAFEEQREEWERMFPMPGGAL